MLLNLAITLWLLIALPSAVLLWRYGYTGIGPIILIAPNRYAPRGLRWLVFLLSQFQINYLLATLFLGVALWREYGWGGGMSSYLAASAVFSWAHNSAKKRVIRELYISEISEKSHVVQEWDTLTLLADRYNITAEEIAAANGLASGAPLGLGTRLRIPGATPEKAAEIVRLVMRVRPFWPPKL
jgi:hypothetical protein